MEALRLIHRQCRVLHRKMFQLWRRRHFRSRFVTFSIVIFIVVFFSLVFQRNHPNQPRLFCILILTDPSHLKLLDYQNISWTRHCHSTGFVKYRTIPKTDEGKSKRKEN